MLPNIFSGLYIVTLLALSMAVASKPTRGFKNRQPGNVDPRGFPEHRPLKQFNIRNHKKRLELETTPKPKPSPGPYFPGIPIPANADAKVPVQGQTIPTIPTIPPLSATQLPIASTTIPLSTLPPLTVINGNGGNSPVVSVTVPVGSSTGPTGLPSINLPVPGKGVVTGADISGKGPDASGSGKIPVPTSVSPNIPVTKTIFADGPTGTFAIDDTVPFATGIPGNQPLSSVQVNGFGNGFLSSGTASKAIPTGIPGSISGSSVSGSASDVNKAVSSFNNNGLMNKNTTATVTDSNSIVKGYTGVDTSGRNLKFPSNVEANTPTDSEVLLTSKREETGDIDGIDGGSGL